MAMTAAKNIDEVNESMAVGFIAASELAESVELDSIFSSLRLRNSLPEEWRENYVNTYRKWLVLRKLYSSELLPPNKTIDSMWHEHIVHTQKYFEDCERLFGSYMHHNPLNNPNHPQTHRPKPTVRGEAVKELWFTYYAEEIDYSAGIECD